MSSGHQHTESQSRKNKRWILRARSAIQVVHSKTIINNYFQQSTFIGSTSTFLLLILFLPNAFKVILEWLSDNVASQVSLEKISRDVFRTRASLVRTSSTTFPRKSFACASVCARGFLTFLAQFTNFLSSMNKYTIVKLSSLRSCKQRAKTSLTTTKTAKTLKWLVRSLRLS